MKRLIKNKQSVFINCVNFYVIGNMLLPYMKAVCDSWELPYMSTFRWSVIGNYPISRKYVTAGDYHICKFLGDR